MSLQEIPSPKPEGSVRIVMLGDIVGKPGMRIACDSVGWLRSEFGADALFANAENVADGSGIRCKDYRRLIDAGFDGLTLGDHVYRKREIMEILETKTNIIRPCNLPKIAPGDGAMVVTIKGDIRIAIVSALGRVFMKPVDCPFKAVEGELDAIDDHIPIRLIDFHAEATSDKQLMGRFLDGRVSAVLGTHTHVATADSEILPGGTGYQTDIGMTGPMESILGRKIQAVMEATLDAVPIPFQVATGDVRMHGAWMDIAISTGKCLRIGRVCVREQQIEDYHQAEAARKRIL